MAADHAQLEAAVSAVTEPELGVSLGDLGLVKTVRARRRRVHLEVALPVAAWPGTDELADEIHRAALAVDGVEEVDLEFVVMSEQERAVLRQRLRAGMLGAGRRSGRGPRRGGSRPRTRSPARTDGSGAGLPRRRRQDEGDRRVIGQGRCRQVDGDGESGHRPGPGRPFGGSARRRRLRLLGAQDAGHGPRPGDHRRHRHSRRPRTASAVCPWGTSSPTTSRSSGGGRCSTRRSSSS